MSVIMSKRGQDDENGDGRQDYKRAKYEFRHHSGRYWNIEIAGVDLTRLGDIEQKS